MSQLHVEVRLQDADDGEYIARTEVSLLRCLSVLCAHFIQIEDAFHDFLTKEHIRPVHDGEELRFGPLSKLSFFSRPGTDLSL